MRLLIGDCPRVTAFKRHVAQTNSCLTSIFPSTYPTVTLTSNPRITQVLKDVNFFSDQMLSLSKEHVLSEQTEYQESF